MKRKHYSSGFDIINNDRVWRDTNCGLSEKSTISNFTNNDDLKTSGVNCKKCITSLNKR